MIWLALAWPALFAVPAVLFHRRISTREWVLLFAVPGLLITWANRAAHSAMTTDIEYWGGLVEKVEFYEAWDERVPCRHRIRCDHRDDEGRPLHPDHGTEHEYDVDEHPPRWLAVDSNGIELSLDPQRYRELAQRFGEETLIELNRDYHRRDGDLYRARWDGTRETAVPVTTDHRYENRILKSSSIYRRQEIDPDRYTLFRYPEGVDPFNFPALFGLDDPAAARELDYLNGKLGPTKQVRIVILVFTDQPREAALEQEAFWQGGNKNEFVVCIGTEGDNRVQWAHVFSWTEVERLKIEARDAVMEQAGQPLDLQRLVAWLGEHIERDFVRKKFSDFDYIQVEIPLVWIVGTHLATVLFCGLWLVWSVVTAREGN